MIIFYQVTQCLEHRCTVMFGKYKHALSWLMYDDLQWLVIPQ